MSRKHSTALGVGAAVAGAAVAAFLGMGTAYAEGGDGIPDGYSDLFGATGTVGLHDAALDASLFAEDPVRAGTFDMAVDQFETYNVHPVADLINALDPSAFVHQFEPDDIVGTFPDGSYLVPDDTLGYYATLIDFFFLNSTGQALLGFDVVDLLLASPPF
jgi:hypothetical protein